VKSALQVVRPTPASVSSQVSFGRPSIAAYHSFHNRCRLLSPLERSTV